MKNETANYQTTDFLICAVLFYFGHELNKVDKSNPSRCIFNIEKKYNTENILEEFHKGLLIVEPKRFQVVQKEIKSRLYN